MRLEMERNGTCGRWPRNAGRPGRWEGEETSRGLRHRGLRSSRVDEAPLVRATPRAVSVLISKAAAHGISVNTC